MSNTKGDGFGKEVPEFGPRPGSRHIGEKPAPARADFKKWARRDSWHIAEGAMLILGFESLEIRTDWWPPRGPAPGFVDIYETALRSDGFTAKGLGKPPRFPGMGAREGISHTGGTRRGREPVSPQGRARRRWPKVALG